MSENSISSDNRLWEAIEGLRLSIEGLQKDLADRQERSYRSTWTLLLATFAVLISIGAIVSSTVSSNISRVEGGLQDTVIVLNEYRDRIAVVGHNAVTALERGNRLREEIDKMQERDTSLSWRISQLED